MQDEQLHRAPKYKGPNFISCPPKKKNLNLITNIKRLISIWCFSSLSILQKAPFITLLSFYSPKKLIFIIYFSSGLLILWDGPGYLTDHSMSRFILLGRKGRFIPKWVWDQKRVKLKNGACINSWMQNNVA